MCSTLPSEGRERVLQCASKKLIITKPGNGDDAGIPESFS